MDPVALTFADLIAKPEAVLPGIEAAARDAGEIALASFREGERTAAEIWSKTGGSPVTAADIAVDEFLNERLGGLCPAAGWLSEETADDAARLAVPLVWIVDPIDGTRAFMNGHRDWSVAIGLFAEHRVIAGVVHAPALGVTYSAVLGHGARRNGEVIRVSARDGLSGARTAGPPTLLNRLAGIEPGIQPMPKIPSLALRLARVAEGSIEAGLVSRDARDWDLAAADLILTEAGGTVTNLAGEAPLYNRPMPVHGALVASGAALHPSLLQAARHVFEA